METKIRKKRLAVIQLWRNAPMIIGCLDFEKKHLGPRAREFYSSCRMSRRLCRRYSGLRAVNLVLFIFLFFLFFFIIIIIIGLLFLFVSWLPRSFYLHKQDSNYWLIDGAPTPRTQRQRRRWRRRRRRRGFNVPKSERLSSTSLVCSLLLAHW